MNYIVYANNVVWKLIDVKLTKEEALKVLDKLISAGIEEYIVIESSIKGDIPIVTSFKNKEENKVKRLTLRG